MGVPFRDEFEVAPIDGLTCLVEVDRVYALDWGRFREEDRRALDSLYDDLPQREVGVDADGGACWFGGDEDVPPFLRASREPGGLRLRGVLPEADWRSWDARFRAGAARLPVRTA